MVTFNKYRRAAMSKTEKERAERTLILCVDRDDDLGVKVRIKTPILGREENLNAATNLALRDPEEPDANAMFEAVRIYDRLREGVKEQEKYQIATITGSELGGVGADRKLVSELTNVLEAFPASDVILVTDGFSDEAVLPLVQSRVPVTSVRRIVVKHSESIEETAAVFSRYLKMLVENPRYSRIVLGLPGILMIVLCLLWLYNLLLYAWIAFLIVVGGFLLVRGFGIDKAVIGFYKWVREYSPPPLPRQIAGFSAITGILLIGIGSYQAGAYIVDSILPPSPPMDLGWWITILPLLAGWFIFRSIDLIVIGVCVLFSGRVIRWFFERDPRLLRTIAIVIVVAWSRQIFYEASQILIKPALAYDKLVFAIVVGILLTVASVLVTSLLYRRYAEIFREKEEKIEDIEEIEES